MNKKICIALFYYMWLNRGIIRKGIYMSKTVFGALPTPEDIRGARAWLGWTQADLGDHVGLSSIAIANIEKKKFNPTAANLQKIQAVFFDSDIEFIPGGGFKKRSDLVRVYEGEDGLQAFFDDVYITIGRQGGEILVSCIDENIFWGPYKKISEKHAARMQGLDNFTCRCLVRESDTNESGVGYAEYRGIPDEMFSNVPFYIYSNKLCIILWDSLKFIILDDLDLTEAYRKQFNFMWESLK